MTMSDEFNPNPEAPAVEPEALPEAEAMPAAVPDRFPISLQEYAITRKLDDMWPAGLAAFGGVEWRTLEEWDALLEAFKVKPVVNQ
jgi:hypothetical protein